MPRGGLEPPTSRFPRTQGITPWEYPYEPSAITSLSHLGIIKLLNASLDNNISYIYFSPKGLYTIM